MNKQIGLISFFIFIFFLSSCNSSNNIKSSDFTSYKIEVLDVLNDSNIVVDFTFKNNVINRIDYYRVYESNTQFWLDNSIVFMYANDELRKIVSFGSYDKKYLEINIDNNRNIKNGIDLICKLIRGVELDCDINFLDISYNYDLNKAVIAPMAQSYYRGEEDGSLFIEKDNNTYSIYFDNTKDVLCIKYTIPEALHDLVILKNMQ